MNTPSERLTVKCQMRRDYNDVLKKGDIVWTTRQGYDDFFMYYANDITPRTGLKPNMSYLLDDVLQESNMSYLLDDMLQELNRPCELKSKPSEPKEMHTSKETC